MAETEVKSINGRTLADVTARAKIEEIKNAAPGLVFDTVADMEAYIAENADTLKAGQDLFIRAADVPDYWWDGTAAVPVETELGEVKEQLNELSEAISEQGKEIPKVFPWAIAELPFDENTVSDYVVNTTGQNPGGFVTNPVGFEDGKPYFQYHAGAKSFTWTNPNPQKGAVTITAKGIDQYYSNSGSARLRTYYDDGTEGDSLYIVVNHESRTVTWTSDPEKTLAKITGNYDLEGYVLLDMDVMSIVADYPAPTGTVKSVNGNLPDENGNVEIPSGGGSGTDIALGISGAAVGQIARITAVDESGVPTAWEAVYVQSGNTDVGGRYPMRELYHTTLSEKASVNISALADGTTFESLELSRFLFLLRLPVVESEEATYVYLTIGTKMIQCVQYEAIANTARRQVFSVECECVAEQTWELFAYKRRDESAVGRYDGWTGYNVINTEGFPKRIETSHALPAGTEVIIYGS